MRRSAKVLLGVVVVLVAMQLITFERTNPPVTGEIRAPDEVKAVLKRACWDCHSNQSVYPWYSRVAPASWLVHRDVVDGRRHLNFSEWSQVPADRRERKQKRCWKEASEGDMPPWFYLPLHSEAQLSEADRKTLEAWADGPTSD